MTIGKHRKRQSTLARALSLLCLFLVMLVALAQTNHVHPQSPKLANHSCSICSVAHSGLLIKGAYQPIPLFARSILVALSQESTKSFLVLASVYIRPPPSV